MVAAAEDWWFAAEQALQTGLQLVFSQPAVWRSVSTLGLRCDANAACLLRHDSAFPGLHLVLVLLSAFCYH